MAFALPPVVAELRANISEYQAKMAEARGEMTATEAEGSSMFGKLGKAAVVGFAATAAVAAGIGTVAAKMASDFEDAHARLDTALTDTGSSFEHISGTVDATKRHFETLGINQTEYQDNLAKMVLITGNADKATASMGLAADIAAGKHMDLAAAVQVVGLVQDGQFGRLKKLGIVLDEHTIKTKNVAAAMKELTDRFGGQAQAQADTFSGKMEALGAVFHDLMIELGMKLVPVLAKVAGAVFDVVLAFEDAWPDIQTKYVAPVVGWFENYVLPVFQALASWMVDQWPKVIAIVGRAWEGLQTAAAVVVGWFEDHVLPVFQAVWSGIQTAAGATVDWFENTAVPAFQRAWTDIQGAAEKVVGWFEDHVLPAFQRAWGGVQDAAAATVGWFEDKWPTFVALFQHVIDAGEKVVGWFEDRWPSIKDAFSTAWDVIKAGFQWIIDNKDSVIAAALAVGAVLVAMWLDDAAAATAAAIATAAAAAPFILAAAAVAGLAGALVYAYEHWQTFRDVVDGVVSWFRDTAVPDLENAWQYIKDQAQALSDYVSARWDDIEKAINNVLTLIKIDIAIALAPIVFIWNAAHDQIMAIVDNAWALIKATVQLAINNVKDVIDIVLGLLSGDWGRAWDALKDFLGNWWGYIKLIVQLGIDDAKQILVAALEIIKSLWSTAWDKLKEALGIAWEGIKTGVSAGIDKVVEFVRGLPGQILGALAGLGTLLVQLGKDMIQGLLNGAKEDWNAVIGWLNSLGNLIIGAFAGASTWLFQAGKDVVQGLIDGLKSAATSIPGIVGGIISDLNPLNHISLPSIPGLPWGASGGVIPGAAGAPYPMIAHGGEVVLNQKQQTSLLWGLANMTPSAGTDGASSGGGGLTMNLTVNGSSDDIAAAVFREADWALKTGMVA